jgi:hypothetical protein
VNESAETIRTAARAAAKESRNKRGSVEVMVGFEPEEMDHRVAWPLKDIEAELKEADDVWGQVRLALAEFVSGLKEAERGVTARAREDRWIGVAEPECRKAWLKAFEREACKGQEEFGVDLESGGDGERPCCEESGEDGRHIPGGIAEGGEFPIDQAEAGGARGDDEPVIGAGVAVDQALGTPKRGDRFE